MPARHRRTLALLRAEGGSARQAAGNLAFQGGEAFAHLGRCGLVAEHHREIGAMGRPILGLDHAAPLVERTRDVVRHARQPVEIALRSLDEALQPLAEGPVGLGFDGQGREQREGE